MGFLNKLPQGAILGRPIWCKRKDTVLSETVQAFLEIHRGVVCTIEGFDEFMFPLMQTLVPDFDLAGHCNGVEQLGKQRAEKLRQQAQQIQQAHAGNGLEANESHLKQDMTDTLKNDSNWWTWEMRARGKKDPDKRDAIYRKALTALPNSAELAGNYASFLCDIRKDNDGAERYYKKALELDPNDANHTGNYANFLKDIRKDNNGAERYFKKALELDPNDAIHTGNYALFRKDIRKDNNGAERLYKKALELDPNGANHTGNYALFLKDIRKDYDGAERLYKKALELDPNDANHANNYAIFLKDIRKDYDGAERLYKKALELAPNDANHTGNYCQFLLAQGEQTRGKELLKRAFSLAPPMHALELELWFYGLAHFPAEYPQAEQKIRTLLAKGVRSNGWNFRDNIARAETDGHPNIPLLRELADAISETTLHAA
jgi:Tfp pilus assembly protein PilF